VRVRNLSLIAAAHSSGASREVSSSEVVGPAVHRVLPPLGRLGRECVAAGLGRAPALHDHLDGAADAHEQHREAREAPRGIDEVGALVMTDVDGDVQPEPAVRGDGFS
jgi:hypothetical protein